MSDARRVKKVRTITNALQKLLKLVPVEYKYQDNDAEFVPDFIAQDFAKVFPQFVGKVRNADDGAAPIPPAELARPGFKGWFISRLDVLIPFIVSALQELNLEVDQTKKRLRKRIEDSDARMAALEARIVALETLSAQTSQRFLPIQDELLAIDKRLDALEAP